MTTKTVRIPNQDILIDAYLVQPKTTEKLPAIIVIQEIFGVNEHIKDVTERLAKQGYITIAPAMYQRLAPNFTAGYTPEDVKIGKAYKVQTQASQLLSDIQATIDFLYQLPQVKKTGVGSIGFCFGGHIAYLCATLPEIKATASFYGAQIATWCPGIEDTATIDFTKEIKGEIHCFFGLEDASIPKSQIEQIATELDKQQIQNQVFRYPSAGHGFFCDCRQSYHQKSAESAWAKVLTLFNRLL